MTQPRCETCRFVAEVSGEYFSVTSKAIKHGRGHIFCRRYPQEIKILNPGYWCGEHTPKDQTEGQDT